MSSLNGWEIKCARCDGHGQVSIWSFGVKEPEECNWCGGSGHNWRYSNGAIARYYSGPLIGWDRGECVPSGEEVKAG